jgi:ribonuclease E
LVVERAQPRTHECHHHTRARRDEILDAAERATRRVDAARVALNLSPSLTFKPPAVRPANAALLGPRTSVTVSVANCSSEGLAASAYEIERGTTVPFERRKPAATAVTVESELETRYEDHEDDRDDEEVATVSVDEDGDEEARPAASGTEPQGEGKRRKRRRRRGRDRDREPRVGGAPQDDGEQPFQAEAPDASTPELDADQADRDEGDDEAGEPSDETGDQPRPGETAEAGQRRRRRRGRRGRRGRRFEEGNGTPAVDVGLGGLPTPAQALDAPDWPATGGFTTTPGQSPQRRSERSEPYSSMRTSDAPVPVEMAPRAPEARQERASIASFFGFGPKADVKADPAEAPAPTAPQAAPAPAAPRAPTPPPVQSTAPATPSPATPEPPAPSAPDNQPKRRGWWQKSAGG